MGYNKEMAKKFRLKLQYPTEKQIQATIIEWINKNGGIALRQQSGVFIPYAMWKSKKAFRIGFKGLSDIVGCWQGRFFAIEVKDHKRIVEPEQRDFIDSVRGRGGIGMVARSLDDVIEVLSKNGK